MFATFVGLSCQVLFVSLYGLNKTEESVVLPLLAAGWFQETATDRCLNQWMKV